MGRGADRGSIAGAALAVTFAALFVLSAVGFGLAVAGHVSLLPRDTADSHRAEVVDYRYGTDPEPSVYVDVRFVNPGHRAITVGSPSTIVARADGEQVADLPLTAHEETRVPAGENRTRTVRLQVAANDTEAARQAVADRDLAVAGVFRGQLASERIELPIYRRVPDA